MLETEVVNSPVSTSLTKVEELALDDAMKFFLGRNVEIVLDIGCGDGDWAIRMAKAGYLVCGFDESVEAVNSARDKGRMASAVADFEVGTLDAIPFEGELFDAAVVNLTFDQASPRQTAMGIDELSRRVRRGGSLFVLFHPYDPSKPRGQGSLFKDNDLRRLFPDFSLMEFRSYPEGFRGLFFRR